MIVAHENVMTRMARRPVSRRCSRRAWPNETYHLDMMKLTTRFHGERGHRNCCTRLRDSDGDTLV